MALKLIILLPRQFYLVRNKFPITINLIKKSFSDSNFIQLESILQ